MEKSPPQPQPDPPSPPNTPPKARQPSISKTSGKWREPRKGQYTFDRQICESCDITAPFQEVFEYTCTPTNCLEWSSATLAITDLTLPFGTGSTWIHRVGAAGLSLDFSMYVLDYQPPHEVTIAVRSPWNKPGVGDTKQSAEGTIRLDPLDNGQRTRFTITARFNIPFSFAGVLVYKLVGENGIRQILRLSIQQLKTFLERKQKTKPKVSTSL